MVVDHGPRLYFTKSVYASRKPTLPYYVVHAFTHICIWDWRLGLFANLRSIRALQWLHRSTDRLT